MIPVLLLLAHSWYPADCCAGSHCHQVPCADIRSVGDYWVWWSFSWAKADARQSQDGGCHVCISADGTTPYCLFLGAVS